MRISSLARVGVILGIVLFAGCGLSQQGVVPSTPAQARHGLSWMARGVKNRDLLYVTNTSNTVSVYRYWQRTLAGVLTDFKEPMGACSDATGHVYIADYKRQKIVEYAHGASKALKTLDDAPYAPWTCSVSPTTGDVAVANSPYDYNKGGNVTIFAHGSGPPVILKGSGGEHFTGCAFDDRGDLLTMGEYLDSSFWYYNFYYLPRKAKQLESIQLPDLGYSTHADTIAGILWDGKYWVVGPDYDTLFLYAINIKARLAAKITLAGGYPYVGPVAVYRRSLPDGRATQLVGGTHVSGGTVEYWRYPEGGNAIDEITKDLDDPFGVAISLRS